MRHSDETEPGHDGSAAPQPTRRSVLRASAAGIVGLSGVGTAVGGATGAVDDHTAEHGPIVIAFPGGSDMYALDAATGEEVWRDTRSFDYVSWSPTVADGTIFGTGNDSGEPQTGFAFAADAATGAIEWTFGETEDKVRVSPTVVDDTVYLGSQDDHLYAVNRETGTLRWRFDAGSAVQSPPTVVGDTAYVAAGLDLIALDVADGSQRWRNDIATFSDIGSPAVLDGEIYIATNRSVLAVNAELGTVDWETRLDVNVGGLGDAVVHGGTVYVPGYGSEAAFALDAGTGDLLWSFHEPRTTVPCVPTVADGLVYVNTGDLREEYATVYAIDTETGDSVWTYEDDSDGFRSSATVHDGILYIGNWDAELLALDAATGELQWSESLARRGAIASAPVVVEDPKDGYGVGSRSRLGAYGHHDRSVFNDEQWLSLEPSVEIDATQPTVGEEVVIDGSGADPTGWIESYEWRVDESDLDRTGEQVTYQFDEAGAHGVTLTITGPSGETASTTESVYITEAEDEAERDDTGGELSDYTDPETGEVTTEGLSRALADYRAGEIDQDTLLTVFISWYLS